MTARKTHIYIVEHVCPEHGIYTEVMAWVPKPNDIRPVSTPENFIYFVKQGCPHCGKHGIIKIDSHVKLGHSYLEKEHAVIHLLGD